jgi:hypothetical protein
LFDAPSKHVGHLVCYLFHHIITWFDASMFMDDDDIFGQVASDWVFAVRIPINIGD